MSPSGSKRGPRLRERARGPPPRLDSPDSGETSSVGRVAVGFDEGPKAAARARGPPPRIDSPGTGAASPAAGGGEYSSGASFQATSRLRKCAAQRYRPLRWEIPACWQLL
eukprot:2824111-Heterocapsa_arctica.AAC.1